MIRVRGDCEPAPATPTIHLRVCPCGRGRWSTRTAATTTLSLSSPSSDDPKKRGGKQLISRSPVKTLIKQVLRNNWCSADNFFNRVAGDAYAFVFMFRRLILCVENTIIFSGILCDFTFENNYFPVFSVLEAVQMRV